MMFLSLTVKLVYPWSYERHTNTIFGVELDDCRCPLFGGKIRKGGTNLILINQVLEEVQKWEVWHMHLFQPLTVRNTSLAIINCHQWHHFSQEPKGTTANASLENNIGLRMPKICRIVSIILPAEFIRVIPSGIAAVPVEAMYCTLLMVRTALQRGG